MGCYAGVAGRGVEKGAKVMTARGLRDRRIRLTPSVAAAFYDIQDRLCASNPSAALEWLMHQAAEAIEKLPPFFDFCSLGQRPLADKRTKAPQLLQEQPLKKPCTIAPAASAAPSLHPSTPAITQAGILAGEKPPMLGSVHPNPSQHNSSPVMPPTGDAPCRLPATNAVSHRTAGSERGGVEEGVTADACRGQCGDVNTTASAGLMGMDGRAVAGYSPSPQQYPTQNAAGSDAVCHDPVPHARRRHHVHCLVDPSNGRLPAQMPSWDVEFGLRSQALRYAGSELPFSDVASLPSCDGVPVGRREEWMERELDYRVLEGMISSAATELQLPRMDTNQVPGTTACLHDSYEAFREERDMAARNRLYESMCSEGEELGASMHQPIPEWPPAVAMTYPLPYAPHTSSHPQSHWSYATPPVGCYPSCPFAEYTNMYMKHVDKLYCMY